MHQDPNQPDLTTLSIEGDLSAQDIQIISDNIIENMDDLRVDNLSWSANYEGLMQLITLGYISNILHSGRV